MGRLRMTGTQRAKLDANEFCVKEKATEFLAERQKCAEKADRYVNYVFEKCKSDTAPFTAGMSQRKAKTLTTIL